jgi:hypothetical protein
MICVLISFLNTTAQSQNADGLTLRGKVVNARQVRDLANYVDVKISLVLEFVNTGSQPIISMKPWLDDRFWHGGTCLSKTIDDALANRCYFSDGMWLSISRSDEYRRLADQLDQSIPPPSLTRILKPGEAWTTKSEINISFEDDARSYRVPWEEMKQLSSPLWMRLSFEMWPFNVETFKPNLAAKLRKRWRPYGNIWIGEKIDPRMHLARLQSEPIELDWRSAIASR